MIKLENTDVFGWDAAIRGMRNPMNSWDKSDSQWVYWDFMIGEKDLELMMRLAQSGTDHGKFLRFIEVTCDITAPLYWWKEHDTYRMGVEKNSCSTMHTIAAKEFTLDDFSHEHLLTDDCDPSAPENVLFNTIMTLNIHRHMFLQTQDKTHWYQIIQLLPSSYNQRRTVRMSYAALRNVYHARKNHKLDEWREFCEWIKTLPYSELITGDGAQ